MQLMNDVSSVACQAQEYEHPGAGTVVRLKTRVLAAGSLAGNLP